MPHKGRPYPFRWATRLLGAAVPWPAWGATEYGWEQSGWIGEAAAAFPDSGRGLLPSLYSYGDRIALYEINHGAIDGFDVTTTLSLILDTDGVDNYTRLETWYQSELCGGNYDFGLKQSNWGFEILPHDPFGFTTVWGSETVGSGPTRCFPIDWTWVPVPPSPMAW